MAYLPYFLSILFNQFIKSAIHSLIIHIFNTVVILPFCYLFVNSGIKVSMFFYILGHLRIVILKILSYNVTVQNKKRI